MKVSVKYRSLFLIIACLAIFRISFVQCEDTGLKNSLATLSTIISWLPKASLPVAPLRLISLLLQLLVKQLRTTLMVLDQNRPTSEISTSSTMSIQKDHGRNWYHPEAQLGRCMLRYAKTEYPETMNRLKINTIATVIDIMFQNGNSLFSDNRQTVDNDDKAKVRSNEMGYAANGLIRRPMVLVPIRMLPHSQNRPLTVLGYDNYHSNYKRNYNARPSFVQNIKAIPQSDALNSYLRKENSIQTEKPSAFLSTNKNNLENHKMDIEPDGVIRKARALNNRDSSEMHVVQTNVSSNETSEPTINQDFKTILLEGLGIDPKSIKKWTPVYCGTEYVIDVLKRADQINTFVN